MKRSLMLVLVPVLAAGCQESMRDWERQPMPTRDRQCVFRAATQVLEKHFTIADSSIVRGTIETEPQVFDRRREGTLADVRGAGGQWRRTVFFETRQTGLDVVARVSVRLQREATDAAMAQADQHRTAPETEYPTARESDRDPMSRAKEGVWMETGHDPALARELLGAIHDRVELLEADVTVPVGQSPREAADEVRRIGSEQGF